MTDCTDWDVGLIRNDKGGIVACVSNVAIILGHHPECADVLAFDEFRGVKVKLRPPPWGGAVGAWDDVDTARVRAWMQAQLAISPSTETAIQAVQIATANNAFDPLVDELRGFAWDGTVRLDSLLTNYFGAEESPYVQTIGRRFAISAVARALRPGCKVDTMLIIEGAQGIKKSSGLREFFGSEFFSDTPIDLHSKDSMSALDGVWGQEFAELGSFSRAEASTIKAYIAKRDDQYRRVYGREKVRRLRRTVITGTTNDDGYQRDFTGGRRFWPFKSTRVEIDKIARDRGQLLAEAIVRLEGGERWWLDEDEAIATTVREQQDQRRTSDPWEQPIGEWLRAKAATKSSVTSYEVLTGALNFYAAQITRAHEMRAAEIIVSLGWTKGARRRRDGERIYPYDPPVRPWEGTGVRTPSDLENEPNNVVSLLSLPIIRGREIGGEQSAWGDDRGYLESGGADRTGRDTPGKGAAE